MIRRLAGRWGAVPRREAGVYGEVVQVVAPDFSVWDRCVLYRFQSR